MSATENFIDEFNTIMYDNFDEGYYIGVMSGTSLDAMDLVIVAVNAADDASPELPAKETAINLIATLSKDFAPNLREVLLALCQPNASSQLAQSALQLAHFTSAELVHMSELDWFGWASRVYAEFVSDAVIELLETAELSADNILAIGCHGQTVRHRPHHGFTLQLVDPNIIAERTAITVVSDFRRRDMAVGGQGAPLVPAFHQALFGNSEQTRVLLNLGGIANITVLPAEQDDTLQSEQQQQQLQAKVIGYDTGPANLLLDAWIHKHTNQRFDKDGDFARAGTVIPELLTLLLAHPYFTKSAPKSTGREDFNLSWLEEQLATFHLDHSAHSDDVSWSDAYSAQDVQATLTELTAISASNEIKMQSTSGNVYVCGGGAYNLYLLERLAHHLTGRTVATTEALGVNPTWIESIAFAWLAKQTIMGQTGNLPAVTGAHKEVVLGTVCFA